MMFKKWRCLFQLLGVFLLAALVHVAEAATSLAKDPENQRPIASMPAPTPAADTSSSLSGYNHVVFQFNDFLDRAFLKPVATLYSKIVPRPLHQGISNVFSNIDNIPTVINDVLQLRLYHTLSDSWRFFINSTVGILGFFDVASHIGLKPHHEDFGLTMARWGYTDSNYFVVPFFGPGTIRDVIGWPIDYFFFSIYPYISNTKVRYSVYALGVVDRRSNLLQYQDVLEQVAVDRYSFMRSAYLQHRQHQIVENQKSGDVASEAMEDDDPSAEE
jgi:phospholipid-binding lipoprotein MlaA